ncbi:MAG: pyruvate:ferredoxin (flavodoxin) oxidoreductase [Planctomycetota bacterium]|nr:pyruvate:ferredoxin (flavodoxin) oxidoreductase [Planctomycetota bacterium]
MARSVTMMDGNQAAAHVAHKVNEVIAIYPITPSSSMGEHADAWSAAGQKNIYGTVPLVVEMQSEGGAAAALHGAMQTGSLTTTFTASQGLLLMIPTMYKIAGELTPTVFHVSARSLACQALSIFGDHSDINAVRQTGFALLASGSVQEAMDMALIASAATLEARVPFVHFFEGFRVSHEIAKAEELTLDDMRAMMDDELVLAHRSRGMTPDKPVLRGTSQNPDVYFQGRETVNPYYRKCPEIVQKAMDKFAKLVGRQYQLFDYAGSADAERVIVIMGSGAETAHECVECLSGQGEKVGVLKVRLYRPFCAKHFADALPKSVKSIAVLDRTKEPGAGGEPLYLDVIDALAETGRDAVNVIGGRYGLSSKEFTPAMVKGVFDELAKPQAKNHFTIGINDDVTHTSLDYDPDFSTEGDDVVRAMFYGLGSDGTVGANKNSIKIIGEETDNYAQGYFVYDSKKAGAITVSHLRFGPRPIRAAYLVSRANFVACHQFSFLERYDVLGAAVSGATFLLNAPYAADEVWNDIPKQVQQQIIDKKLKFYSINAYEVAKNTGMGARINTIMQTCFFYLSGILPQDEAVKAIKDAIKKSYSKKGQEIVQKNYHAVDQAIANLHEIKVPAQATSKIDMPPLVSAEAPQFVKDVTAKIMAGEGNSLPVSAMPADGTWPTATTQWEKRNIAMEIPVWEPDICIQCAKCSIVCPHATIRGKVYDPALLAKAPKTFKSADAKGKDVAGMKWTIQVAPEDCTGCGACVHTCPAKDKANPGRKAINMAFQPPLRQQERENWKFFLSIPDYDRTKLKTHTVKGSQLCRPLFEFSGACAGCGETPYIKLMTQLFGDRAVIGNATGCSSIYGGNLPTTPYCVNADGRGPTWNNSLFEDAAEFSFGFRLTLDKRIEYARELLVELKDTVGADLAEALLNADQTSETGIAEQRSRLAEMVKKLKGVKDARAVQLLSVADSLAKKSVWAFGGDGWAYDIGYGGLDHVLACGRDINVLVLDTQVYSNTGGQCSKATPRAAVAKFAAGGKPLPKKDLGMIAMTYGNIYVAQVAMGANDNQCVKAFVEAESYPGPSIIIAYSHCIAHGINMTTATDQQKAAVACGAWPLYRYDPRLAEQGKNPLQLDSKEPTIAFDEYAGNEGRYKMLAASKPDEAARLGKLAAADAASRWHLYKQMAQMQYGQDQAEDKDAKA